MLGGLQVDSVLDILVNKLMAMTDRAKDRQWHPSQQVEMLKEGGMKMILHVSDTAELLGWILNFGSGVRVVRPDSLREKVQEEAKKIFDGR